MEGFCLLCGLLMISHIFKYTALAIMLFLFMGGERYCFDLVDTDYQVELIDAESGEDESEKEECDDPPFLVFSWLSEEIPAGQTLDLLYGYKGQFYTGDFHRKILFPPES